MDGLTFRKAVPEDLPELYDIAMEAAAALPYGVEPDRETVETYVDRFMGPERSCFVICDDRVQACFGVELSAYWFNRDSTFAKISFLFVKPDARKRHVGTVVMKALRWLVANYDVEFGFDSAGRVEVKDRFFRRFGFERVGYNYIARKPSDG